MSLNTKGFYLCSLAERKDRLRESGLSEAVLQALTTTEHLSEDKANHLIENYIGQFNLPLGLALNFLIDQKEYVLPLVTEEPSVIAAASNAAKLIKKAGGFTTRMDEKLTTGEVILTDVPDLSLAIQHIEEHRAELIDLCNAIRPSMKKRGGGVKEIKVQTSSTDAAVFLTVLFFIDTKEAMGANMVNDIMEGISPSLEAWTGGKKLLAILSNLPSRAIAVAECCLPLALLHENSAKGREIGERIALATAYANTDPYRAVTHNKGIMNGIQAFALATGNDTRAIEAAAHAYAARSGHYQSLSTWKVEGDHLYGSLSLPLALGTVGGAIKVLPKASAALDLLGNPSSMELARIFVALGLAQNLAALKALVSEGIQRGHMNLHASSLAIHAGAIGDEIEEVADYLRSTKQLNASTAQAYLNELRMQNRKD